jgi:hypothetical protein
VPVFCPIAHSHPMTATLPPEHDTHATWLRLDEHFMRAAKGLIVCELDGWEASLGVQYEIKRFREMGKPIVFMAPGKVPFEVLPAKRRVVGLCGHAGAGKDETAAGLLKSGWERVSFADPVRAALLALNPFIAGLGQHIETAVKVRGWGESKRDMDVRWLLQRIGTEAGRDIHGQDCWVNIARRKIEATSKNVVVTDVRFPNEVAMIRDLGGEIIRVDRPGVGPVNDHPAEHQPIESEHTIINDGTVEELHDAILELIAA